MSTPGTGSIFGSNTIWGNVDYGPTFGRVYRPINPKRVVTLAGDVTIADYDVYVIVKQTAPADFNVIMPDLRRWMTLPVGGFDLTIFNKNIGYSGTLVLPSGQLVDGAASFVIGDSQGVGGVVFSPLNDLSGWVTL